MLRSPTFLLIIRISQPIRRGNLKLVDGPLPSAAFTRQTESGRYFLKVLDAAGNIFAHDRPVLESMARATADQPDVFKLRMKIDEKVAVRSVLVLADTRLSYWRVLQFR